RPVLCRTPVRRDCIRADPRRRPRRHAASKTRNRLCHLGAGHRSPLMILDGWFYTGAGLGILSAIICTIATIFRDHPADSSILSLAALELYLAVYAGYALIS